MCKLLQRLSCRALLDLRRQWETWLKCSLKRPLKVQIWQWQEVEQTIKAWPACMAIMLTLLSAHLKRSQTKWWQEEQSYSCALVASHQSFRAPNHRTSRTMGFAVLGRRLWIRTIRARHSVPSTKLMKVKKALKVLSVQYLSHSLTWMERSWTMPSVETWRPWASYTRAQSTRACILEVTVISLHLLLIERTGATWCSRSNNMDSTSQIMGIHRLMRLLALSHTTSSTRTIWTSSLLRMRRGETWSKARGRRKAPPRRGSNPIASRDRAFLAGFSSSYRTLRHSIICLGSNKAKFRSSLWTFKMEDLQTWQSSSPRSYSFTQKTWRIQLALWLKIDSSRCRRSSYMAKLMRSMQMANSSLLKVKRNLHTCSTKRWQQTITEIKH